MILGVDPGIATCGWSVVVPNTGELVAIGAIISPHDRSEDDTTDRARRLAQQGDELRAIARRFGVTTIAAEAVSLGGPPKARLAMATCLSLSWGALVMLALELGAALLEIRPKQWQQAIQEGAKKIDYDALFNAISAHILQSPGHESVAEQLRRIAQGDRNHALDGYGIGLFAAFMPHLAKRIVERRKAA
jgi:Holliday junction resolvasome RuvABC endonuclease subunit